MTQGTVSTEKLTISLPELQALLSVGRNVAARTGKEAGAVVRIGGRRLYRLDKIRAYIDTVTETGKAAADGKNG